MGVAIQIEIEGFDQLLRALDAFPGLIRQRVEGDGLAAAARVVSKAAIPLAPVISGALKSSIRVRRFQVGARIRRGRGVRREGHAAVYIGRGRGQRFIEASHAVPVIYGTARGGYRSGPSRANDFINQAFISTQNQQLAAAARGLERSYVRLATRIAAGNPSKNILKLAGL